MANPLTLGPTSRASMVQSDADPLAALHALLGGGGQQPSMHANDAVTLAGLREQRLNETNDPGKKAAVTAEMNADPFTGTAAQKENNDSFQHYQDLSHKLNDPQQIESDKQDEQFSLDKLIAPARVAGQYGVQQEQVKQAGAMNLANANREGTEHLMNMLSGGQPGQPGAGQQPHLKPAVNAQGQLSFTTTTPPQETAQTRTMGETANDILDVLHNTGFEQQAKDMQSKGLFAPGIGWLRRAAVHHGLGSFLGQDQATTQGLGQFESAKDMLVSAVQRAHAGARGAGNEALASRFEQMLNDSGDLDTFLGQLHGVLPFLQQYASHNPDGSRQQPGGVDPYNDPNWGAK